MTDIATLIEQSGVVDSPVITERSGVSPGGVDPLGLRQLNFDLMDEILPGLNNVANRVKPFLLMAWAWRQARRLVAREGGSVPDDELRDFVDRIEAVYAWSQFLTDPDAGIPGRQALAELLAPGTVEYEFGGAAWVRRRDLRRSSTGLISPLNYGPGLRSMGWLQPVGPSGIFRPDEGSEVALDAFEAAMGEAASHPAFNQLGPVVVRRDEAQKWGNLWSLAHLQAVEREAGLGYLLGPTANATRRRGLAFIKEVAASVDSHDVDLVRRLMADATEASSSDEYPDVRRKWRRLQTRQLFRLCLEGWFYWMTTVLAGSAPMSTISLASRFIAETDAPDRPTASWFMLAAHTNPVPLIGQLEETLHGDSDMTIPQSIVEGLRCCLREAEEDPMPTKGLDRLPLRKAASDFARWKDFGPEELVGQITERWILAQHAYWCVGRGLADARGSGKTILRLRIVMEEGGWTLTPGTKLSTPPVPTADRLATALSLLRECGELKT